MQLTHDHEQIRDTLKRYIDEKINPHVDEWEAAEIFPAHQVFKGLGDLVPDPDTRLHVATIQGMVKRLLFPADDSPPMPVQTSRTIPHSETPVRYAGSSTVAVFVSEPGKRESNL